METEELRRGEWRREARRRLDALAAEYGTAATWDGDVWRWLPAREDASPVTALVEDPWTLTVCFGAGLGRAELGYRDVDLDQQLDDLVALCRAVADGGLREELRPGGSTRWQLRLPDGVTVRVRPRDCARRGGGGGGGGAVARPSGGPGRRTAADEWSRLDDGCPVPASRTDRSSSRGTEDPPPSRAQDPDRSGPERTGGVGGVPWSSTTTTSTTWSPGRANTSR